MTVTSPSDLIPPGDSISGDTFSFFEIPFSFFSAADLKSNDGLLSLAVVDGVESKTERFSLVNPEGTSSSALTVVEIVSSSYLTSRGLFLFGAETIEMLKKSENEDQTYRDRRERRRELEMTNRSPNSPLVYRFDRNHFRRRLV